VRGVGMNGRVRTAVIKAPRTSAGANAFDARKRRVPADRYRCLEDPGIPAGRQRRLVVASSSVPSK
jgi:hypothetical protein